MQIDLNKLTEAGYEVEWNRDGDVITISPIHSINLDCQSLAKQLNDLKLQPSQIDDVIESVYDKVHALQVWNVITDK